MQFVAVLTTPELVFRDNLLSTVGTTQVQDLIIVENNLDVSTNLEELRG